ncbi:hypothetical protein [Aquimarina macrocephali]|uniref:hypothetical protein n=1 Tax=Aquimarina macrocephali TaxID=666563 RepID=UPI003F678E96
MRKLLLFIYIISFITTFSCSKDERAYETLQEDKELIVKQTLVEFNKSAIRTGRLQKFTKSLYQKSLNTGINDQELELVIKKFMGDQTQAFLDLYHQLNALNVTPEEFYSIAHQFGYLRLDTKELDKSSSDICNSGGGLLVAIFDFVIGCEKS